MILFKKLNSILIVLIALFALISSACSSQIQVTETQAEEIAREFIIERVKFFATEEDEKVDLPVYTFNNINVDTLGNSYIVDLYVTSTLGNDTKEGNVIVTVDSGGKVTNLHKK